MNFQRSKDEKTEFNALKTQRIEEEGDEEFKYRDDELMGQLLDVKIKTSIEKSTQRSPLKYSEPLEDTIANLILNSQQKSKRTQSQATSHQKLYDDESSVSLNFHRRENKVIKLAELIQESDIKELRIQKSQMEEPFTEKMQERSQRIRSQQQAASSSVQSLTTPVQFPRVLRDEASRESGGSRVTVYKASCES